ncbi:MAG: glycoside hydrolase [Verrucomicrobiota bacterium]
MKYSLFSLTASLGLAALITVPLHAQETEARIIRADVSDVKGPMTQMPKLCVGSGYAPLGLRADWQQHLKIVKNTCDFEYIRFHGIFHEGMGIFSGPDKKRYNWQYVDKVYDYILSIGMKPFVEISFMPNELASNKPSEVERTLGKTMVFNYNANVTPPKSYDDWAHLVTAFTQHLTDRYGEGEVGTWYFECWNEANCPLFWTGDRDEYFKLYDATARAVKSVSKDYRTGGPSTAASRWVPELIEYCEKNVTPIDFFTTHEYGIVAGMVDGDGVSKKFMKTERDDIIRHVKKVRGQIEASKHAGAELHYTEWSASYSSRDPIHDSYHMPAYILQKVKGVEGDASSMSYWVFSDVFEESGPGHFPFHGGFGLLNLQGLKKPSFYAYKFFNDLGDTELNCSDADSWVTKEGDDVQVLLWNFTPVNQGEEHNRSYFTKDLPAADVGAATIKLDNLEKGKYEMNVYKVGYRVNDVYADFRDMGSPDAPTLAQVAELAQKNNGSSPVETLKIKVGRDGMFTKQLDLRENDVVLLTLTKK